MNKVTNIGRNENETKARDLLLKYSPTVTVRELVAGGLDQTEAEEMVLEVLEQLSKSQQRFCVSKDVILERYYSLYSAAVETGDIKAAKVVLDKINTMLGYDDITTLTAGGNDKIILKFE